MSAKTMPRAMLVSRACLLAVAALTLCALLWQGCGDSGAAARDGAAADVKVSGTSAVAGDGLATERPATETAEYAPSPTANAIGAPDNAVAASATPMPTITPAPTSTVTLMPTLTATSIPMSTPATLAAQCSNGVAVPNPTDNPGLVADCATLLAAKDTLEGEGGNLNWSADVRISDWEGVAIRDNRVSSLLLVEDRLNGAIPSELGSLANLKGLYLPSNDLTGVIPPELGNLANLYALGLGGNQLTGEIPPKLGNLSNLEVLELDGNRLTGEIPSELGNLSNLEALGLSGNRLTGRIPPDLGNLPDLLDIYLDNNQLTGAIPLELGNLANLMHLYLNSNSLTGAIPSELGNLANLVIFDLRGNQLTGCIPESLREPLGPWEIEHIALPFCDAVTATPTPTSTPTITPTPTATRWTPRGSSHGAHLPNPFSIEEWILRSDTIARVKLLEVDDYIDTDETISAIERRYGAELWFEFEVVEYLKGSGNSKIWGVANAPYYRVATKEEAKAVAKYLQDTRDTRWDDREAIIFLSNENISVSSTSHPDRYALSMFIPGEATHSLKSVGGWFPMSSSNDASGASDEQRLMLIDPDSDAPSHIAEDTKRARNTWRELGASESFDMTTMAVSDLRRLIANESELLRREQERQIATMRNRTAPQELTATQTSAGIMLRWTFVEAELYFTTSYRISRKASGEAEFTKISDVQPQWNVTYEDITATEPGVAYTYKVTAILKDDIPSRFNTSYGEYGGEAEVSITTAGARRTPTLTPTTTSAPAR